MAGTRAKRRRKTPPTVVVAEIRKRVARLDLPGVEVLIALRAAAQQMDNAVNEWLAGSAGSLARFQILMALRATRAAGVSHTDIVAEMGVTRATVSGLMGSLEREGLVKSTVDTEDRRRLIARLTAKGEVIVEEAFRVVMAKLSNLFTTFSRKELAALTVSLNRIHDEFMPSEDA